jgi:hypothetical protein
MRQGLLSDWTRHAEARMEQKRNMRAGSCQMTDGLAELRAREGEISREWRSLVDALNTVARVRAEQCDAAASNAGWQRRVELRIWMAQLKAPRPS